jgi:ribosome-binding protein aMBF1 (putative translation factor)
MNWSVETPNGVVDSELEALPADMRARFRHISAPIEEFGLERVREPHVKHLAGCSVGNALEGQRRDFKGALFHRRWTARHSGARVHQENAEGAKSRNRAGTQARKGDFAMSKVSELHQKWMKDKKYRAAFEELAPEFDLARAVIQARVKAGLTQEQLAQRMETTQSVIARLESGRTRPSTQTLQRLAAATGTRLKISFETARA